MNFRLALALIATIAIIAFIFATGAPAKSQENYVLQAKHELPHGWHLTIVGHPGGAATSCAVQSEFTSPGTDLVPRNGAITLMLLADESDASNHFDLVFLTPSWNLPKGFKTTLRFTWDDMKTDRQVYQLDATRWPEPYGIMSGVNADFINDFALKQSIEVTAVKADQSGLLEIGGFPLRGSKLAVEALRACEATLGRTAEGRKTPKDFGDYLKDRL